MQIRSSLKKKSVIALGVYLAIFIAIIGSVTYFVVESPVRAKLKQNLDLRTEILSSLITEPLNSSQGFLNSIVGVVQSEPEPDQLTHIFRSLMRSSSDIVVSAGVWPEPFKFDSNKALDSYFFNKTADGSVDQLFSYNNPHSSPYQQEDWYTSATKLARGQVTWSDVYIDPYTHIQMITASSPYFISGELAGVASVDLSLEGLLTFIKSHAEEYDLGVMLRDRHNQVLVSYSFNLVEGIYISKNQLPQFGWQIDVVNSKLLVADEVFSQVMSIEGGIAPFLLLCVMAGYYLLNRYLITPIITIAQKIDGSKAGSIIDFSYSSQDEIGHLIKAFNEKTIYLEAEKVKAQASTNAKTAFLATLSHEIRTPMNGVLGTAQILLKTDLTDTQSKHLKSLYESGDHMMTLLNEILDFSKIEQGRLDLDKTRFPLHSIIGSINSIYFTLASEKGLQFKVYSEVARERWYYSDKARLRQILFNLLNNAIKFTSRGFVEVYLNEVAEGDKTYLKIRVRDSGIGISKEAQQRIFLPFEQAESSTTRRFGGTGLGLAIVKKIAELMNGDINVVSEQGIGTSFDVKLEIQPCQAGEVASRTPKKLNYSGLKALIVEDNRINTVIIETFMNNKGFDCSSVENGELAVQALMKEKFDLVLMDNHMPVMDGVEATTAIRSLPGDNATVLIFGCTADVFQETRERMLGAGVDYIVAKPIDESELDDALFRYSNKLYQFVNKQAQDEAESIVESGPTTEQSLVALCVAIEDTQYMEALASLEVLTKGLKPTTFESLCEELAHVKQHLQAKHPPAEEVLERIMLGVVDD